MKKLVQHIKTGKIELIDVPVYEFKPGHILVMSRYSAISRGTELSVVKLLQSNLLSKMKQKPEALKKVVTMARRYGVKTTVQLVSNTLEDYFAPGYSLAGEVIEADEESEFQSGDFVACAGSEYANHQEISLVPKNLCVKVPQGVSLKSASFSAIGAVSVWALKEADASFGERGLVIGLGLIGTITAIIMETSGIITKGVDLSKERVNEAKKIGIDAFFPDLLPFDEFDFVIVAASGNNEEILKYALSKTRRRGRIVVVGVVPITLDRNKLYEKEVKVSVSRSYGAGRYDPYYELLGYRYPIEFVRWDIKENMRTFLYLLKKSVIPFNSIIKKEFGFSEAPSSYKKIEEKNIIAAVFHYERPDTGANEVKVFNNNSVEKVKGRVALGVIGAGKFIQGFILPHFKHEDVDFSIVCNEKPESSFAAAKKFNFARYTVSVSEVFKERLNLIVIGTRHDTHGSLVKQALLKKIPVYTEKPLTIYPEEAKEIENILDEHGGFLHVGFNRRFAPFVRMVKESLKENAPIVGLVRVLAGKLQKAHWTKIREIGGDRITGEICHFVDTFVYLSNSNVLSVYAKSLKSGTDFDDNIFITLKMQNGSVFTIMYTEYGDNAVGKEYYELHQGAKSFIIDDFRRLIMYYNGKKSVKRGGVDKGHGNEVKAILNGLEKGVAPILPHEILNVTNTTFAIRLSLREGREVFLREF